eukprot:s1667_g7.t1
MVSWGSIFGQSCGLFSGAQKDPKKHGAAWLCQGTSLKPKVTGSSLLMFLSANGATECLESSKQFPTESDDRIVYWDLYTIPIPAKIAETDSRTQGPSSKAVSSRTYPEVETQLRHISTAAWWFQPIPDNN